MKLNGVNIATARLEEMAAFYQALLDAPCVERGPGRREVWAGESFVALCAAKEGFCPNPQGCLLEFGVEDIDEAYRRLERAGILPEKEPETLPWGYRYFVVEDPDGNRVDMVQCVGK